MTGEPVDPNSITWEEPPQPAGRKPSKWAPIADALRSNPGQWAKVVSGDNIGLGAQASKGELICFRPAGSFEHRTVLKGNRFIGDVYLRYIGEHGEYKDDDK